MKNNTQLTKYSPDTIEDLKKTDLVKLSRDLLGATVESTKALDPKIKVTPDRIKELKITLGFLNATVNATKAKMQFFRMVGMTEKIKAIRKMSIKVK